MQAASSAGSVKGNFVASHRAVSQGGPARAVGDFEPFDVFERAASVAHKMMMRMDHGVEKRRFPFRGQLAHQARARQVTQSVVNRRPRCQRETPVQRRVNLLRGGVNRTPRQIFQHAVALRGSPQSARAQILVHIDLREFGLQNRLD